MHFQRPALTIRPQPVLLLAPAVSLLLIFVIFLFSFFLAIPNEASVRFPRVLTSDIVKGEPSVISITAEQVISFNNRVVTLKELRKILTAQPAAAQTILIKADRRASIGRLVDVWNLCRELGIGTINFATSKER